MLNLKRLGCLVGFALICGAMTANAAEPLEPLPLKLAKPAYIGTPKPPPGDIGKYEKPSTTPRPPFLAPKGCKNLAINRPVTSSDPEPLMGKLEQITDGDKEGAEGSAVEFNSGKQWIQIDLGATCEIHAFVVWHNHRDPRIYKGVVVQVANDPDFIDNVQTVFNNDQDNSVGLGIGSDLMYFENHEGRLMPARGVKGRFVRLWSKGSSNDDQNHYTEVEVWGLSK